jgi:hypothetical protein
MEKKECPNPINTSSNMGIGNLVKETASVRTLNQPPFAFPAPKEKRKCISASMRTRPASVQTQKKKIFNIFSFPFFFLVRADRANVRTDGKKIIIFFFSRVCTNRTSVHADIKKNFKINFFKIFFPASVRIGPVSARTEKKLKFYFFSSSVRTQPPSEQTRPAFAPAGPSLARMHAHVRVDGILPRTDTEKPVCR